LLGHLSAAGKQAVFADNASRFYLGRRGRPVQAGWTSSIS
jgi:hypothetical protein